MMPKRAHPRSRGEHGIWWTAGHERRGSSPLTRGAHLRDGDILRSGRLIPAHAGSTAHKLHKRARERAHPRSRGEHWLDPTTYQPERGSSPLTRGALPRFGRWWLGRGLIPAHAGSTSPSRNLRTELQAHPRSRGEHFNTAGYTRLAQGSSPLTRGALGAPVPVVLPARLIPAHAGSTVVLRHGRISHEAHPRSRGEHLLPRPSREAVNGSSPLTRGALGSCHCSYPFCWLIPAHAGSTGNHQKR